MESKLAWSQHPCCTCVVWQGPAGEAPMHVMFTSTPYSSPLTRITAGWHIELSGLLVTPGIGFFYVPPREDCWGCRSFLTPPAPSCHISNQHCPTQTSAFPTRIWQASSFIIHIYTASSSNLLLLHDSGHLEPVPRPPILIHSNHWHPEHLEEMCADPSLPPPPPSPPVWADYQTYDIPDKSYHQLHPAQASDTDRDGARGRDSSKLLPIAGWDSGRWAAACMGSFYIRSCQRHKPTPASSAHS